VCLRAMMNGGSSWPNLRSPVHSRRFLRIGFDLVVGKVVFSESTAVATNWQFSFSGAVFLCGREKKFASPSWLPVPTTRCEGIFRPRLVLSCAVGRGVIDLWANRFGSMSGCCVAFA
jgi:hypothetical protein